MIFTAGTAFMRTGMRRECGVTKAIHAHLAVLDNGEDGISL